MAAREKEPRPAALPEAIATSEEIEQAVSAWASAQNQGDFESYRAAYAAKFTGVKRSAEREAHFDREGWMKDRAKMFEKPFTLGIQKLSTAFAPGVGVANFEQHWQSDTYRDRGTKRLLFVREGAGLVISREEMLDSTADKPSQLATVPFEQAALATKTLDSFALLVPGKPSITWASDHPRYISNERAQRSASIAALPTAIKKHLEARYEVFDKSGARCEVKPIGFQLMVHIIPHFGTINFWEGRMAGEGETSVVMPNSDRAISLWSMGTGPFETDTTLPGITLGLEMEATEACPKPIWGRVIREGSVAPAPWVVRPPDVAELKAGEPAVSQHPLVVRFDQEARKEGANVARWYQGIRAGTARILEGARGEVFFYAHVEGTGGCGSNTPPDVGLLLRKQGERWVPMEQPLYPGGQVEAAIDLDGDGQVELIAETSILTARGQRYVHILDLSPLSLDCPC